MKYKTLVMKQIDRQTYQYSMNAPLDNLSSILSFDEEILEVNYGNELEHSLNCAKPVFRGLHHECLEAILRKS